MLSPAVPLHVSVIGKEYVSGFQAQAVTTAIDFFEIVAASTKTVFINEICITQSTEFGDAAAEQLRIALKRGVGNTVGAGGNADVTKTPVKSGDSAAASTVDTLHTTQAVAGGGTLTTLFERAVPVDQGFHYQPERINRFTIRPGERFVVSLDAAPADSITFTGYVVFEESGSSKLIQIYADA